MSVQEIKKKLEAIKNVSQIYLTGGEPTLHKDIFEIISLIKTYNIYVELLTNGLMFSYRDFVKKLKARGLNSVYFSFHSHDKKISEKLSRTHSYDLILKGIHNSISLGLDTKIVHVINSLNYRFLPDFIDFLHENLPQISFLNLSLINPVGEAMENSWIVPKYIDIKPFLKKAIQKCIDYKIFFCVSSIVPLCLIDGFEHYASSTKFKLEKFALIDEAQGSSRKLNFSKPDNYAEKADQCKNCTLNEICVGFFPNYKKLYGDDEFIASSKSAKRIIEKIGLKL